MYVAGMEPMQQIIMANFEHLAAIIEGMIADQRERKSRMGCS
jgi:hypothetical protein